MNGQLFKDEVKADQLTRKQKHNLLKYFGILFSAGSWIAFHVVEYYFCIHPQAQ